MQSPTDPADRPAPSASRPRRHLRGRFPGGGRLRRTPSSASWSRTAGRSWRTGRPTRRAPDASPSSGRLREGANRGQQVEAGDPVVLPFTGSVPQFAALVEVDGALQGMVRLALVQADQGAPAHVGVRGPLDHEQGAFDAPDFPVALPPARSGAGTRRACAGAGSAAWSRRPWRTATRRCPRCAGSSASGR